MAVLSYRYRIEPNKTQAALLAEMLADFCGLYNCALEHRIKAYEKGVSVRCNDQITALPAIRKDLPNQGRWSATAQQQVFRKLDKTFKSFFGRCKRGQTPGFPRFRARDRYHAADFRVGDGLTIRKNRKLGFVGIPGEIKVRWHRELPSKPASAILSRNAGKWYIIFHVEVEAVDRASPDSVGVDLGLTSLLALSNGETVARPNITKRNAAKLRRLQRASPDASAARKSAASARPLPRLQAHIGAARRDFLHKESRKLVNRFGRIAFEDLNTKASLAECWRSMFMTPRGLN